MNRFDSDDLIDALLEGRATPEDAARLLGDTAGEELEELSELIDTLSRIDPQFAMPSDSAFRGARQSVLARITAESGSRRGGFHRWLPLAAALAAFAVGLAVGKGNTAPTTVAATDTLTDLVARSAQASDPQTHFRYSNLRLQEVDPDTLALTVDVAAELDIRRPKDDLLVNDILANALLSEDSLGARLKVVEHAGRNPRVQRALISAALNDPDMSVRLKALERLIAQDPGAATTQATLLAVVENEESVVMRLMALDALSDDNLDSSLLDSLETDPTDDGGNAVFWHAQQRLNRRSL